MRTRRPLCRVERLFRSFRRVWESRHLGPGRTNIGLRGQGLTTFGMGAKAFRATIHKSRGQRGHVAQRDTRRRRRDESLATAAGGAPASGDLLGVGAAPGRRKADRESGGHDGIDRKHVGCEADCEENVEAEDDDAHDRRRRPGLRGGEGAHERQQAAA